MVEFEVGPGVRCDLVGYSGPNMSGLKQPAQFFPQGARRGRMDGTKLRSLLIRAVPGTRVLLKASKTEAWEQASWRCVRVLARTSVPSGQKNGLPGVRIPDLDRLDEFGARKTDRDFEQSIIQVESLAHGTGWTFGRGLIANRVAVIRIEREDTVVESARVSTPSALRQTIETLEPWPEARDAVLEMLRRDHPEALREAP